MRSYRPKPDSVAPFHVVLDGLRDQEAAPGGTESAWRPAPAWDWTPLGEVAPSSPSAGAAARVYGDADLPAATTGEAPRCLEDTVAQELQLSEDLQPADLERIRRTFAYRHHPDRVGAAYKAQALQRMTVANVLIDQALKGARTRVR
jgi:hypothetical protein